MGAATMNRQAVLIAMLCCWLLAVSAARAQAAPGQGVVVLDVVGAISPATAAHVKRGLDVAARDNAAAVVLRLDTPGGLDTSMREIVQDLIGSPVPVLAFVAPSGARAASAGTFILYASHVAAMAPGTNLGAATPVALGGGGKPSRAPDAGERASAAGGAAGRSTEAMSPSEAKAVNDAVAYIRALADLRGRDADWAEAAVRQASSLPAREALSIGAVDIIANDVPDLLAQAHGRQVRMAGGARVLETRGRPLVQVEADWRTRVLAVIANPNVAMLLMMIGVYGLLFEFMSPGAVAPGVLGAISLLLGLYALSALPLNLTGVALLLLGVALLVAEAFSPSFGILGLGGVAAFVLGAGLLVDVDAPGLSVSMPLMSALAVFALLCSLLTARLAWRTRRLRSVSGSEALPGRAASVLDWSGDSGHVLLAGERWHAVGASGLAAGQTVQVQAVRGLTVRVVPEAAER